MIMIGAAPALLPNQLPSDFMSGGNWAWIAVLGLLGAIFGSFIAALVIRWPQERSIIEGRSACDSCDRPLGAIDLVPILSGLWLRGRCRHCGARIDPLHQRIELIALLIGVSAGLLIGGVPGLIVAIFGWILLAMGAMDATEFWLPDPLALALAITGVASAYFAIAPSLPDRAIGGVAGFASLWSIGAGYKLVRGREGLGGGDPKMLGAIGLWVGWRMLPVIVLLAAMVGLGVALFRMASGTRVNADDRLPFGALLAIAAYPAEIAMLLAIS